MGTLHIFEHKWGELSSFWDYLTTEYTEYTEGMWRAETRRTRSGGGDLEKEKVAVPVSAVSGISINLAFSLFGIEAR